MRNDTRALAQELINEALTYNIFGAGNRLGAQFQESLFNKFNSWKKNKKNITFKSNELELLKPIIAQSFLMEHTNPLAVYPYGCDSDLPVSK